MYPAESEYTKLKLWLVPLPLFGPTDTAEGEMLGLAFFKTLVKQHARTFFEPIGKALQRAQIRSFSPVNPKHVWALRREMAAYASDVEPLPPGTQSAGGMLARVTCLHALVAHELAAVGVNPFGAEALEAAGAWWRSGPCVDKPCVDEPGLDAQRVDEHCVREDVP